MRLAAATAAALLALALLLPAAARAADPEAWRSPPPAEPAAVLVRGATVWTQGPDGVLDNADLLVERGRVVAVGRDLAAPPEALVVDARGKHVTPGMIDAHSHVAIDGEVNERSQSVTAEVRIADVLNPADVNLYRQLAGGLTTANVLHGSANAIGGQNAVIKLRWGASAGGLLLAEAPSGIKLALGENPKRSNLGRRAEARFPATRSGVEQVLRQTLRAALAYEAEHEAWRASPDRALRVPPRRDLRLEALLEVLRGERLVHAHSYRADEILMLLDVAEGFGFRIATLQHVLEGYKVADEIAAHGAGASTFSDWWAYKYEVIDAIPWNGALMHERGVLVSFNSDSDELARRMPLEAAKAMRYGGLSPAEALDLVTLNPAKQLGLGARIGSLEPGKDADFVVWSGDPLSTASLAEQTWIDGRKYFDREDDLAARAALAAERQALIAKVRAAAAPKLEGEEPAGAERVGSEPPATEEIPLDDPIPEVDPLLAEPPPASPAEPAEESPEEEPPSAPGGSR